ncbi:MAG: acetyl-CoA carboxylase biotin carboxylase subunit [Bacteroidetes bacterium]|nr:MAG: acetyl-CoA carboxylase biotin carboxylase subunit [Bacteroidota bacterium]
MKINKILIANRGEIALRVMRSAREMGIKTVAVFSEADRIAPFVRYADEAVCIGAPPSSESYLKMDTIIAVAKERGADAIHPGYGFLSENAVFARKVQEAGLIFIGPSPESIVVMGSKLGAKEAAGKYNIPMVPGTPSAITDIPSAKKRAEEIGYPVLIKASAGGGGKGMRVVENTEEFEEQMDRAISEAVSAFGDGAVFIEKYIGSPKHIEIQVLGDQHGNVVYLFERECSVQRRHQKLIEEAPSPVVSPEMRKAMGECAVMVAKSCNYYGAGTVEFIVDEALNFYFLEMNTRLQVEHPVTELITGIDLVKEQIRVAQGEALSFKQEDLQIHGHAIEIRVCAEDPRNNFLPDIGKLLTYQIPKGVGIRVDDGVEEGMTIPIYYDPMLAKLITHGKDRQDEQFVSGKFDTNFIKNYFSPEMLSPAEYANEAEISAMLASLLWENKAQTQTASQTATATAQASKWRKNRL